MCEFKLGHPDRACRVSMKFETRDSIDGLNDRSRVQGTKKLKGWGDVCELELGHPDRACRACRVSLVICDRHSHSCSHGGQRFYGLTL